MQFLLSWDQSLFRHFNQSYFSPWGDEAAVFLCKEWPWAVFAVGLFFVLAFRKDLKRLKLLFLSILLIMATDSLCARVLKPNLKRDRPCSFNDAIRTPAGCGGRYGFPSNHSANAMGVAALLFFLAQYGAAAVAICVALLIGFLRMYLGVHFPTDILAGYGVGLLVALPISSMVKKMRFFSVAR